MTNDTMLGGLYLLMAAMLVLGSLMARREPAAKMLTMRWHGSDLRGRLRPVHLPRQFRLGCTAFEG